MTHHDSVGSGWLRSRAGTALLVFLAITAFFLLTEHRAHLYGVLPYLLLLLCPILHLLMHGRHGGHGREDGKHGEAAEDQKPGSRGNHK